MRLILDWPFPLDDQGGAVDDPMGEEMEAQIFDISEDELMQADHDIADALAAIENPDFKLDDDFEDGIEELTERDSAPEIRESPTAVTIEIPVEEVEITVDDRAEKLSEALAVERAKNKKFQDKLKEVVETADQKLKKLRVENKHLAAELETVREEMEDFKGRWIRVNADYKNFQKRSREKMNEFVEIEQMKTIRTILPVMDNFKRAIHHKDSDENGFVDGVVMIFRQMGDLLNTWGVKEIPSLGEPFDPYIHEALHRVSDPEKPDNVVLEVYSAGYFLRDKVLVPAKVVVNCLGGPGETRKKSEEEVIEGSEMTSSPDTVHDNGDTEMLPGEGQTENDIQPKKQVETEDEYDL